MSDSGLDRALTIIDVFEKSDLHVLHVRGEAFELFLSREEGGEVCRPSDSFAQQPVTDMGPQATNLGPAGLEPTPANNGPSPEPPPHRAPPTVGGSGALPAESVVWTAERHVVRAPMLGAVYRSAEPEGEPFVVVGKEVNAGDTVLLIEAMKVFTAVSAGTDGYVEEILIETGDFVEYDQDLLTITPKSSVSRGSDA